MYELEDGIKYVFTFLVAEMVRGIKLLIINS